jgi:hypothetical protein
LFEKKPFSITFQILFNKEEAERFYFKTFLASLWKSQSLDGEILYRDFPYKEKSPLKNDARFLNKNVTCPWGRDITA